MIEVVAPLVGAAVGVTALAVVHGREAQPVPVRQELRFPGDVTERDVQAVLAGISGLPRGSHVTLEVVAEPNGIRHVIEAPVSTLELVTGQLRGIVPGLRLEEIEPTSIEWNGAIELRWRGRHQLLRSEQADEAAASLLGSLLPLRRGEALRLRWTLAPTSRPRLPQSTRQQQAGGLLERIVHGSGLANEEIQRLRAKYTGALLRGQLVVAVRAASPVRAQQLLSRVVSVVRARGGHGAQLEVIRSGALSVLRGSHGGLFSPAELAGIIGWPIDAPRVAGLVLGAGPQLLPSPRIPSRGRVVGRATWPGMERSLAQPVVGGLSHSLVVGPTGVGKSSLLANLIVQDLRAGRGCLVLDGKGDLADDILARVPERRVHDVIVLDPAADVALPGVRVFGSGDDAELASDLVLGVFRDLFADAWGPRSEHWLRAGLLTLAHAENSTLADLPFLFADAGYRRGLVGRLDDPMLRATWAGYEAMSAAERAHQLAAPLNKVEQLVGRRRVRAVLAQPNPRLDMSEVLRAGRVVVVSLSAGRIGTPAARLIGALVVYQLFAAVQARAALPASARRAFFAYIDEPRVLGDLPVPLDSLFELARGMGVGLTLAAQSVTQLSMPVQRALLTNAATLIAFRQSADDARLLARDLPGVTPEELQHLGAFEVVARLGLGPGDVAPTVTARTNPLPAPSRDADAVRRCSAERYGISGDEVEAALRSRHESPSTDGPIGRSRRSL